MGTPVLKPRCELITDFEQLNELSANWDRLWRTDPHREIFQSFAWAQAWWRAYSHECSLYCLVIYDDRNVIGILPLVQRGCDLEFLGAPQADYTDIVCEEERTLEVLLTALSVLYNSKQWKKCKLEHLPSHSRIVRHWQNLPHRVRRYSRLVFGCYCYSIRVDSTRPNLLAETARKGKMNQHANKLSRLGVVKSRFVDTEVEAQEHLSQFFRYHARRWALMGKSSDSHLQQLLEGLVRNLDLHNELRFSTMEVDGNPVAYQIGFDTPGKYTLYQQTFDVNLWQHHPGNVLMRHMLLYAAEKGVREFDFTVGDETYKTRYTNCIKHDLTLHLGSRSVGGLVRCYWATIQSGLYYKALQIRARLERYPKLHGNLEALLKWVRDSDRKKLRRPGIMVRRAWSLLARACKSIWQVQDRVLYRIGGKSSVELWSAARAGVEISVASQLSDIADLVLEGCNLPGNLDIWRTRLTRGDQLIIVREGGKPTLALWATSSPMAILPAGPAEKSPVNIDSSCIAYEYWSSVDADFSRSYRVALAFLIREAEEHHQRLWVCGCSRNQAQERELSTLGFEPAYHMQDWRIFYYLRFHSASSPQREVGKIAFSHGPSEETGYTTKTNP